MGTPSDYQPPGYCPNSECLSNACAAKTRSEVIGKMKTKFHGVGFQLSSKNLKKTGINEKENTNRGKEHSQMNVSVMDMVSGLDISVPDISNSELHRADENAVSDKSETRAVRNEDTARTKENAISNKLQKMRLKSNSVNKVHNASRPSKQGDTVETRDALKDPIELSKIQTPVNAERIEIGKSGSHSSLNSTARSQKASQLLRKMASSIATRKHLSVKDTFPDLSQSNVKASKYHTMIPF